MSANSLWGGGGVKVLGQGEITSKYLKYYKYLYQNEKLVKNWSKIDLFITLNNFPHKKRTIFSP